VAPDGDPEWAGRGRASPTVGTARDRCYNRISPGMGMAQNGAELGELSLRHLGGQDCLRTVKGPAPLMEFDRHASLHQALRIGDRFIAVGIELCGRDVGGWEADRSLVRAGAAYGEASADPR